MDWTDVFNEALKIAEQVQEPAALIEPVCDDINVLDAWYNRKTGSFKFRVFDDALPNEFISDLSAILPVKVATVIFEPIPTQTKDGDFVCLHTKVGLFKDAALEDKDKNDLLSRIKLQTLQSLGGITGFNDKYLRAPGFPSPVAATIGGGLLGAGIGAVGGSVADALLPEEMGAGDWKRRGIILGGLLGTLPGAALSYGSFRSGLDMTDGHWMRDKNKKPLVALKDKERYPAVGVVKSVLSKQASYDDVKTGSFSVESCLDNVQCLECLDDAVKTRFSAFIKSAALLANTSRLLPQDTGAMTMALGGSYKNGYKVGRMLSEFDRLPDSTARELHKTGEYGNIVLIADKIIFK
jgi:hypothetical protein